MTGENHDWTYRAAEDVKLTPGVTTEVAIELIRGVEVEGSVVLEGRQHSAAGCPARCLRAIPAAHRRR